MNPDFDFEKDQVKKELKDNKVSYNFNPPFWGPGNRAVSKLKKGEKKALEKEAEGDE